MLQEKIPVAQRPRLVEMQPTRVAVLRGRGTPAEQLEKTAPALYGSAYKLKFALKKEGRAVKVGPLRARWPDAHLLPKDQWMALWALPVPDDTTEMPQKVEGVEVTTEVWEYGTVAQVLHIGPYTTEGPAVARLHAFIEESGYEIAGDHEEEYLTSPDARVQKTLIRYPVRPRK